MYIFKLLSELLFITYILRIFAGGFFYQKLRGTNCTYSRKMKESEISHFQFFIILVKKGNPNFTLIEAFSKNKTFF